MTTSTAMDLTYTADEAAQAAADVLAPGRAVIVDCETAQLHGAIIEIAVVDAATGAVLLDTLVDPGAGVEIDPGAQAVHGLSLGDLAGAPTWDRVLGDLLDLTAGRLVTAYSYRYDRDVIVGECARYGVSPAHLGEDGNWRCLMEIRCGWEQSEKRIRLDGGHRAAGDCLAARDVLLGIAGPVRA